MRAILEGFLNLGCTWPLEKERIFSVYTLNSDVASVSIQTLKLLNLLFICVYYNYY